MKQEINKKFNYLLERTEEGKKRIYGYRNKENLIVVYSPIDDNFAVVTKKEILTNDEENKYVKNISALFNKFDFINFIILEKPAENIKVSKEVAKKINKKIIKHITETGDLHGKIEIPETKTTIYYSRKLRELI